MKVKSFLLLQYFTIVRSGKKWSDRHRRGSIRVMYGHSKRVLS